MSRSLNIAIIGAGAAGLYTASQLMCSPAPGGLRLHLLDQQPAPLGLLAARGTGAPVIATPGKVTFFGNITVGTDVTLGELESIYDAVIDTTSLSEPVTEFTLRALIDIARAQQWNARETKRVRVTLKDLINTRALPATAWKNPLHLPGSRSLAQWQRLLETAHGVPVCF